MPRLHGVLPRFGGLHGWELLCELLTAGWSLSGQQVEWSAGRVNPDLT